MLSNVAQYLLASVLIIATLLAFPGGAAAFVAENGNDMAMVMPDAEHEGHDCCPSASTDQPSVTNASCEMFCAMAVGITELYFQVSSPFTPASGFLIAYFNPLEPRPSLLLRPPIH
jgi:hypothetical protein